MGVIVQPDTIASIINDLDDRLQALESGTLTLLSFGFASAAVVTTESTATAPYVDLATVGPQTAVQVGLSGAVMVIGCVLATAPGGSTAEVGYTVDGAAAVYLCQIQAGTSTITGVTVAFGLTPGNHTIGLQYGATNALTCTFGQRILIAQPL